MAPRALKICLAAAVAAAAQTRLAVGLELKVGVHYPEKGGGVEKCGFALKAAAGDGDEETPVAAERAGRDYFEAVLSLPDSLLYTQVSVAVMASFDANLIKTPACQAVCDRLGPQGMIVMQGPFVRTGPLTPQGKVEVWPSFCAGASGWGERNVTFRSAAIGRGVQVVARLPGAVLENPTPRPTRLLPPVMFRFNSEWYWPHSNTEYTTWHDLMINGMMESVVVAEIWVDGINWKEWNNQPIFTTQDLSNTCTCAPELQFICDSWLSGGYNSYSGGDHHFGKAAAFYDEIYEQALPSVLLGLPGRTDLSDDDLRLGTWGYCIGGLAAWNALTYRPGRFNIAYLGSPAMDFDCGAPFEAVKNLSWTGTGHRPKVYIDAGAAEGNLMRRQTLILMRRLQERGAIEGSDVFYERLDFGTHQGRSLLRRGLRGLLVLFGTEGGAGFGSSTAAIAAYTPVLEQASVTGVGLVEEESSGFSFVAALVLLTAAIVGFALAVVFLGSGRKNRRPHGKICCDEEGCGAKRPLL